MSKSDKIRLGVGFALIVFTGLITYDWVVLLLVVFGYTVGGCTEHSIWHNRVNTKVVVEQRAEHKMGPAREKSPGQRFCEWWANS